MLLQERDKIIIVFSIIFAVSLFFYYAIGNSSEDSLAKHLDVWGVSINQESFTLVDFSENSMGGLVKEALEARSNFAAERGGGITLKITKVNTSASQKYVDDKRFVLESLFLPTTSPYPGVITNARECPEEFRPVIQKIEQGTIYTLFAGARFNYGVCAQDLVEYYSTYGIFDCKEKGIFEVRIFSKIKEEPQSLISSFVCG